MNVAKLRELIDGVPDEVTLSIETPTGDFALEGAEDDGGGGVRFWLGDNLHAVPPCAECGTMPDEHGYCTDCGCRYCGKVAPVDPNLVDFS